MTSFLCPLPTPHAYPTTEPLRAICQVINWKRNVFRMISLLSLAVCMLLGTVVEILGKPTASSRTARSVTTSEARTELEPAKPSYLAAMVSCQTLGSPSGSTCFPADVRREACCTESRRYQGLYQGRNFQPLLMWVSLCLRSCEFL